MSIFSHIKRELIRIIRRLTTNQYPSYDEIVRLEWHYYIDLIQDDMVVFDVGAHLGEQTMFFHNVMNSQGVVHAFEPSKDIFDKLKQISELGAFSGKIIVNNLALSDKEGLLEFHTYSDARLNTLIERDNDHINQLSESVVSIPTTTLDKYCLQNEIYYIDFVKIDVEGAELAVLKGAEQYLKENRIKQGIFEFGNTWFEIGINPQEVREYLEQFGYTLRNIVPNTPLFPMINSNNAHFSMIIFELAE